MAGSSRSKKAGDRQQRAGNGQALAHAAGKIAHGIVAAGDQARRLQRSGGAFLGTIEAIELGEEFEILLGGQFVVQQNVVSDHADALLHGEGIVQGMRAAGFAEAYQARWWPHQQARQS